MKNRTLKSIIILMADDDKEDCMLVEKAFRESRLANDLRFVEDGEELMDYLYCRRKFEDPSSAPRPGVILLDLNMPKKSGQEALKEIKDNADLRAIPVVVLTTSQNEADVLKSYDLGANSYISKPVTFQGLVEVVKSLGKYWFEVVELPEMTECDMEEK